MSKPKRLKNLLKFKMPKKSDLMITVSVVVLILLGTMMIISTSVGETYGNDWIVIKTIVKQFLFIFVAYLSMVNVANYFSFETVSKHIKSIGGFIAFLMVVCLLFPGAGGAKSWIYLSIPGLGQMSIQPSEFFKVFMIVCMACFIEKAKRRNWDWLTIIKGPLAFYGTAVVLLFLQHDLGTLIVLSLICAICLIIPSHPNLQQVQKYMTWFLLIGGSFVVFLASDLGIAVLEKLPILEDYQIKRFTMAANPFTDEYNHGVQLINSLYAFASGGFNGLGIGQSIQKMQYLPEALTDYILAITVEELGIFGFVVVLVCYGMIIYKLFMHAFETKKDGYKIVYIGTSLYLFFHFVFNVGGVTGLIPLTGIPLLFISSGASSLVSICGGIGICQSLISKENRERAEA